MKNAFFAGPPVRVGFSIAAPGPSPLFREGIFVEGAPAGPFFLLAARQMVDFSLGPTGIRASAGRFVQDQGAAKPRNA